MTDGKIESKEPMSVYFLKLVMYFLLGSIWLHVTALSDTLLAALPLGLLLGLVFASHDHFQIDRKIEFAILLIASLLSFIAPVGLVLKI